MHISQAVWSFNTPSQSFHFWQYVQLLHHCTLDEELETQTVRSICAHMAQPISLQKDEANECRETV